MEQSDKAVVPAGQRPDLTQDEYDEAVGLVAHRPSTLAELGIDESGVLPWDDPEHLEGCLVPFVAGRHIDHETVARLCPTRDLILFLAHPRTQYERYTGGMGFGTDYVYRWRELAHRVQLFRKRLDERRRIADERERIAEERAARAEERAVRADKRARIMTIVAIVSALTTIAGFALKFF